METGVRSGVGEDPSAFAQGAAHAGRIDADSVQSHLDIDIEMTREVMQDHLAKLSGQAMPRVDALAGGAYGALGRAELP